MMHEWIKLIEPLGCEYLKIDVEFINNIHEYKFMDKQVAIALPCLHHMSHGNTPKYITAKILKNLC